MTSLAYFIRQRGDACVIGVGGGRDILTALWAGSRSVTGIEINEALIYLLTGPLRDFAALADRPEVTLVHDEARSYLTRTRQRFDVLMGLCTRNGHKLSTTILPGMGTILLRAWDGKVIMGGKGAANETF